MITALVQYIIREFRPVVNGYLTKLFYSNRRVKIGKNFKTDNVPKILIEKNCKLIIGDNVEMRRNIEIRIHNNSEISIGNDTRLDRGIRLLSSNSSKIILENGVRVGLYSVLNGGDSIVIGKKALISGFVYLQTSMHGFKDKSISVQEQGYEHAPIKIGDDVWIGTHVVVMPGIHIGKGGIVGSNAVVTKDVGDFEVVAGIPAKSIKNRI